jgi:hypothetical protein
MTKERPTFTEIPRPRRDLRPPGTAPIECPFCHRRMPAWDDGEVVWRVASGQLIPVTERVEYSCLCGRPVAVYPRSVL